VSGVATADAPCSVLSFFISYVNHVFLPAVFWCRVNARFNFMPFNHFKPNESWLSNYNFAISYGDLAFTGSHSDETSWLPNTEMTKPCEVSDETSTYILRRLYPTESFYISSAISRSI
jgi:hypothetical protein